MHDLDHRRLGIDLDLFHFEEDAPGMPFYHPNGYAIYRELEDLVRARMRRLGYREVRSPQVLPVSAWERSGHWAKFQSSMFRVSDAEGGAFALKPMSCPCHLMMFNKSRKSFRDLPVRYAEFGACHRDEASGAVHGLMRTRSFEQDDAHVVCREDQVRGEVSRFVGLLRSVYGQLGFPDFEVALSTRPAARFGDDALWDWAEAQLLGAARDNGLEPVMQPGEGAFYGPKLEFALKDRHGRAWQCGTVQLDAILPGRLGASYIDENDEPRVPVMIHHAVLGSIGRFIAILVEHHGGDLPFWLAPEQVAVLGVSDVHGVYARELSESLLDRGVRVVEMDRSGTLSRKLVEVRERRIPVALVVGGREAEARSVSIRERDGSQRQMAFDEAVDHLARRRLPPPSVS